VKPILSHISYEEVKKIIHYIREKPAWGQKEQINFIKVSQPEKVYSTIFRLQFWFFYWVLGSAVCSVLF
jgi:hypothetical protein